MRTASESAEILKGGFVIAMLLVFAFLLGRCSTGQGEDEGLTFGPLIAPTPSEASYDLGPPHNQMFEPPQQFFGDARVITTFMLPESVAAACQDERASACANYHGGRTELILPNPCRWFGIESYASLACHELAHANGWKHPERGDPDFPKFPEDYREAVCHPPARCAGDPL